jgi:hypothetical protein
MGPKCIPNFIATCDGHVQIQLSGLLVSYGTTGSLKMKNMHGKLIKLELEIFSDRIQSGTQYYFVAGGPFAGWQMFI